MSPEAPRQEAALAAQIEEFKREKERIRSIVGRVGGIPSTRQRIFNVFFAAGVAACFIASIATHGELQLSIIELGIMLLSLKIMYLIHTYAKQMHFMFWILSSIEWRLNELVRDSGDGKGEND